MLDVSQFLVVLTTFPNESTAKDFAQQVVDQALCSCVHIHAKGLSMYRWQGRVQEDAEVQVVIKCVQDQYAGIERYIQDHHPYDVPECIAIPLQQCAPLYGQWLRDNAHS